MEEKASSFRFSGIYEEWLGVNMALCYSASYLVTFRGRWEGGSQQEYQALHYVIINYYDQ